MRFKRAIGELLHRHAHLDPERGDGIIDTAPVLDRVGDFSALLRAGEDEALSMALRRADTVERPLGERAFMDWIEVQLGRDAKPGRRGPAKKGS